jgi:acyl dehydratase
MAQTAAGAGIFPHVMGEAMVAFIEASAKFKGPVYAGDTLYPQLEITGLKPGRTTGVVTCRATVHNQDGEMVLEGEHKYLIKRRNAEESA